MDKIKVYIASPYTKGNTANNVRLQIDFANRLMDEGFYPYTPLLSHFHELVHPRDYDYWIKYTLEWMKICDVVLRVGSDSKGADQEVKIAKSLGIPVFDGIMPLLKYYKKDFSYTSI